MGFSLNLQRACNRAKRMTAYVGEVTRNLLEPFVLKELYPLVDYERPDGTWGKRHEILPHQKKLHDGIAPSGKKAKFIVLSGGVGSGKTYAMCVMCLYYLKTYPGIKIVVSTAFDYFFSEFLMPTWRRVLDDDDPFIVYKNVKERAYKMVNGSEIRFHAYIDPDNIRGWEAHIIWIDEGAQIGHGNNDIGYALWTAFIQRMRAKPDHYPHMMYVTQNPSGHNWIWKVFIKPETDRPQPHGDIGIVTRWGTDDKGHPLEYYEWEKVTPDGDVYYALVTSSYANKYLTAGYISSMLGNMADQKGTRERMVEGRWTPINSLVYEAPLYSPDTHCIDYQRFLDYHEWDEVPSWNRVVVGIDCGGQRSPWAVEYYMYVECDYYPPRWVCFDEIYVIAKTWDEIADQILEKQRDYGFTNIQYWIDPISSNHSSGPRAERIKDEFLARGIATHMPRGYNKYGAINRVHSFLLRDRSMPCPYKDDDQVMKEDGTFEFVNGHAKLYYLQNCPGRASEIIRDDGKKIIMNAEGYAAPGNMHEKTVYRYDNTKNREPKAAEEGLTQALPQKIMDRDDHAQTSEMFAMLGIAPLVKQEKKKSQNKEELRENNGMYGSGGKRRRI